MNFDPIIVIIGLSEHRPLGRTGVSVSKPCLGTMMFGEWGTRPRPGAIRHRAAHLIDPHPQDRERDLPLTQRYGMGVPSCSPLAGGWLSGRYRKDTDATGPISVARQRLANRFDMSLPQNQRKLDAADQLAKLADGAGISLIEMAIAFVLRPPAITAAIVGPRSIAHLDAQLAAADVVLTDAVLDRIDETSRPASPSTLWTTAGSALQPAARHR